MEVLSESCQSRGLTINAFFMYISRRSVLGLLISSICGSCTQSSSSAPEKVTLDELLPDLLLSPSGDSVARETLQGKFIGLYFSASWCPPCRAFTPVLINFRNECIEKFEVVLVGLDKSAQEQQAYVSKSGMPWLSLPNKMEHKQKLQSLFGIRGIPSLIVVSPDGLVVSTRGRKEITKYGSSIFEDWLAKASAS